MLPHDNRNPSPNDKRSRMSNDRPHLHERYGRPFAEAWEKQLSIAQGRNTLRHYHGDARLLPGANWKGLITLAGIIGLAIGIGALIMALRA